MTEPPASEQPVHPDVIDVPAPRPRVDGAARGDAAEQAPRTTTQRLRKGRTLEERKQERREALLDAALELYGTKGYAATTIEELCRAAFVSTRNFYEEFEGRPDVLVALGDRIVREAFGALVAAQTEMEDAPVEVRVRTSVGAVVHALLDDPRVGRVAFIESRGVSPVHEARRRDAHHLFAQFLTESARAEFGDRAWDAREPVTYALGLVGAFTEVLTDWVLRDDKPDLDQVIDELVDFFLLMRRALFG